MSVFPFINYLIEFVQDASVWSKLHVFGSGIHLDTVIMGQIGQRKRMFSFCR